MSRGDDRSGTPVLEITDLSMRFGGLVALDGLSFAVPRGQIVGLIGPNGAGKTTVFNLISRFYTPTGGTIRLLGEDLLALHPHEVPLLGVARTFQNLGLFPFMSVLDNLLVGNQAGFRSGALSIALGFPKVQREEKVARGEAQQLLEELGMASIAEAIVGFLPYGTRKFVELARALMSKPKLLLLDEPVAGLNATETAHMGEFIRKVRQEHGLSILLVEHDMSLVMSVCEQLVVLDFGKKIAEGTPEQVQCDPKCVEAYLGEEIHAA